MRKRRALITGVSGMDGSHLADFLLTKDYEVHGVVRPGSTRDYENRKHLTDKVCFHSGNLTNKSSLLSCLHKSRPDEVYNLAAESSSVGGSWQLPELAGDINALGTTRMLEAIRMYGEDVKFYQAGSSEMFGRVLKNPANEQTPFHPKSPYGVAKVYSHLISENYRESYNMFNCNGILFNHESERSGHHLVSRKICRGVAKIKIGVADHIELGNLESSRDWGYAPDYVEAMWMMMQADVPSNYVIATNKLHSIKDFLTHAFRCIGIEDWGSYVLQNPKFMRPIETDPIKGDPSKAMYELGWKQRVFFPEMVKRMVDNDIRLIS